MARRLPLPIRDLLPAMPKWAAPLDVLRTVVSALASFDQDAADNSHEANQRKAERLLAQMPVAIADFWRITKGLQPIPARQDLPIQDLPVRGLPTRNLPISGLHMNR